MSEFDFDTRHSRAGTGAIKWTRYGPDESDAMLPFWVADMDFRLAPVIEAALSEHLAHGILGYSEPTEGLNQAFVEWLEQQYAWRVQVDWLVWLPGVVPGFNIACRLPEGSRQAIMMNTPLYYPCLDAPEKMGHRSIHVPLDQPRGQARGCASMDFERMQASLTPDTRMFLACNPQNPTGRVYSRRELTELAEFCLRNDLLICSDEIHAPLVLDCERRHHTIAEVVPEIAARTIALFAPSKAWNLAGLGCAVAVIPDATLRQAYLAAHTGLVPMMSPLAMTAAEAAYRDGEPWREALIDYLRGNLEYLYERIGQLPGVTMRPVEGTCLAWIDVSALAVARPASYLRAFGIALSEGEQFKGAGHVRLNFGCPRAMLEEGLARFETGVRAALDGQTAGIGRQAPDSERVAS